jgi:hypothetical protein
VLDAVATANIDDGNAPSGDTGGLVLLTLLSWAVTLNDDEATDDDDGDGIPCT